MAPYIVVKIKGYLTTSMILTRSVKGAKRQNSKLIIRLIIPKPRVNHRSITIGHTSKKYTEKNIVFCTSSNFFEPPPSKNFFKQEPLLCNNNSFICQVINCVKDNLNMHLQYFFLLSSTANIIHLCNSLIISCHLKGL